MGWYSLQGVQPMVHELAEKVSSHNKSNPPLLLSASFPVEKERRKGKCRESLSFSKCTSKEVPLCIYVRWGLNLPVLQKIGMGVPSLFSMSRKEAVPPTFLLPKFSCLTATCNRINGWGQVGIVPKLQGYSHHPRERVDRTAKNKMPSSSSKGVEAGSSERFLSLFLLPWRRILHKATNRM